MDMDIQKNESPVIEDRIRKEPVVKSPALSSFLSKHEFIATGFHRGPVSRRGGYAIAAWSFVAAGIDALVIFSLCCFIFAGGVFALHVKLHTMLHELAPGILEALIFFALMISAFYLILLRSFLNFTLGEWACGLRLGSPKQRLMSSYILKVVARTLLIYATGLVLLPALSLITGRDLPGLLLKLPLVSLR
jgi:hypothetical protein